MRWSQTFIHTQRNDPADAEVVSHRMMVRAGLIAKVAAGIYNYLPLDRGDTLTASAGRTAIRELYNTGFFQDISLRKEGNILVKGDLVMKGYLDDVEKMVADVRDERHAAPARH